MGSAKSVRSAARLVALTVAGTVVVSMCLAPRSERDVRRIPSESDLERIQRAIADDRGVGWNGPPLPSTPEPAPPHHMPPAVEQLRTLEVGVRSMILY